MVTEGGAAGVQRGELGAHQPSPPVGRVGGDHLRPADAERDTVVGPGLGDQEAGGDDPAAAGILDQRRIIGDGGWVVAAEQVARPGGHLVIRLVRAIGHRGCQEGGQRLGVLGRTLRRTRPSPRSRGRSGAASTRGSGIPPDCPRRHNHRRHHRRQTAGSDRGRHRLRTRKDDAAVAVALEEPAPLGVEAPERPVCGRRPGTSRRCGRGSRRSSSRPRSATGAGRARTA